MEDFLNKKREQYILCAAIWFDDEKVYVHQPKNIQRGIVVCGWRHGSCFAVLSGLVGDSFERYRKLHRPIQGFLTSDNLFVDRHEGAKIAVKSGQVVLKEGETLTDEDIIFSEDLY